MRAPVPFRVSESGQRSQIIDISLCHLLTARIAATPSPVWLRSWLGLSGFDKNGFVFEAVRNTICREHGC